MVGIMGGAGAPRPKVAVSPPPGRLRNDLDGGSSLSPPASRSGSPSAARTRPRRYADEEAARKAAEELARKSAELEAARKAAERDLERKAAKVAAARKAVQEKAALRTAKEAEEKAKLERKAEEFEAAKKAAEEELRQKAVAMEEANAKAEEDLARKAAALQAARRTSLEDAAQKAVGEELARQAANIEAAFKAAREELDRKAAELGAARVAKAELVRKATVSAAEEAARKSFREKALRQQTRTEEDDVDEAEAELKELEAKLGASVQMLDQALVEVDPDLMTAATPQMALAFELEKQTARVKELEALLAQRNVQAKKSRELSEGPGPEKSEREQNFIAAAVRRNARIKGAVASLTDRMVSELVKVARKETLPTGCVVYREGDLLVERFYVLQDGKCELTVADKEKSLGQSVGELLPGSSFGELELLYITPRTSTVQALEDSAVWVINRSDFMRILLPLPEDKVDEYEAHLKNAAFFSLLSQDQRRAIAQNVREGIFTNDDMLLRQGDAGHVLYVLCKGTVSVTKDNATLGTISAGGGVEGLAETGPQLFGSAALLNGRPQGATLIVTSQLATIFVLHRDILVKLTTWGCWTREELAEMERTGLDLAIKGVTVKPVQELGLHLTKKGSTSKPSQAKAAAAAPALKGQKRDILKKRSTIAQGCAIQDLSEGDAIMQDIKHIGLQVKRMSAKWKACTEAEEAKARQEALLKARGIDAQQQYGLVTLLWEGSADLCLWLEGPTGWTVKAGGSLGEDHRRGWILDLQDHGNRASEPTNIQNISSASTPEDGQYSIHVKSPMDASSTHFDVVVKVGDTAMIKRGSPGTLVEHGRQTAMVSRAATVGRITATFTFVVQQGNLLHEHLEV